MKKGAVIAGLLVILVLGAGFYFFLANGNDAGNPTGSGPSAPAGKTDFPRDPRSAGPAPAMPSSGGAGGSAPPPSQDEIIIVERPKPIPVNFDLPVYEKRSDGKIVNKTFTEQSRRINAPGYPPEEALNTLGNLVDTYRKIFLENPIAGSNAEVVTALTGDNPYDLIFLDPGHPDINAEGELVDRWGTPFRFHPVSSKLPMEIFSAGPDQEFGTSDDVMLDEPQVIGPPDPVSDAEDP